MKSFISFLRSLFGGEVPAKVTPLTQAHSPRPMRARLAAGDIGVISYVNWRGNLALADVIDGQKENGLVLREAGNKENHVFFRTWDKIILAESTYHLT